MPLNAGCTSPIEGEVRSDFLFAQLSQLPLRQELDFDQWDWKPACVLVDWLDKSLCQLMNSLRVISVIAEGTISTPEQMVPALAKSGEKKKCTANGHLSPQTAQSFVCLKSQGSLRVKLRVNFAFIIYNILSTCSPLHMFSVTVSCFWGFCSTYSDQCSFSRYSRCFLGTPYTDRPIMHSPNGTSFLVL